MRRSLRRYLDIGRNLALDLRYRGFLGRPEGSRFGDLGAHAVVHTDVQVLAALFANSVEPGDVLVDVGCGKGRVIHFWLSRRLKNEIFGLELDPDIAARTQQRLRRFSNVTIFAGSAVETVPSDATLLYLSNPFDADVLAQFSRSVSERCPAATLFYYNPQHIDVFLNDPEWVVENVDLTSRLPRSYTASSVVHRFAVVRLVGAPDRHFFD